jgi:hypothetical protein
MFIGRLHWRRVLGYSVPGLFVGLALAYFAGGRGASAQAQAGAPGLESNGTIAFTSSSGGSSQMLYLIDTRSQSFAVYRVDSQGARGTGSVKLEAARQYRYDLKLSEYNNQPPEVSAIEAMVRSIPAKH